MNQNNSISVRNSRLNNIILSGTNSVDENVNNLNEALSKEGLLDSLFVLYEECSKDVIKKKDKNVGEFVTKYRPIVKEAKSLRVNLNDFEIKELIGKGYFGEVHLVSEKHTGEFYAMKKMKKGIVTSSRIREERDIMASRQSEWITFLQYAFQDQENLYLVMEYLPGGDLLGLMMRVGVFEEDLARFYLAEMTEALHSLHSMGYVHRDIKPENILLDRFGHLKLVDFGNATVINKDGSVTSMTPVGTPDYIAPELLETLVTTVKSTTSNHDVTCDFWSMGIIGYEFVTEVTPFHDDNVNETFSKIMAHCEGRLMKKLTYPQNTQISADYRDLIDRLVTKVAHRMTYSDIKHHNFFKNVNWDKLRYKMPPFVPSVSSDDDTSNFEDVNKSSKRSSFYNKSTYPITKVNDFSGENLPFLGYSFVYEDIAVTNRCRDNDEQLATSRLSRKIKEQEKLIKEHIAEIHELQKDLLVKERKMATMNGQNKILDETKKELENMKEKLKEKTAELAACKTDVKALRSSLKIEEEQRLKNDATIADVLRQTYKKWEKAKQESDRNYEKQIAERKTEFGNLLERIKVFSSELETKTEECEHLQQTVSNYKDMLKKSKDSTVNERDDFEKSKKQIIDSYEEKIADLKAKMKMEKDLKNQCAEEMGELRRKLDENRMGRRSILEVQKNFDRNSDDLKKRYNQQLDENEKLRQAKLSAEKQNEELQKKLDDYRRENGSLKDQITSSALNSALSSNRSSFIDLEFKSANSSIQEINTMVEEQLRSDLLKARESEDFQRKRAEGLEEIVGRLEKIIEQFKECPVAVGTESLLEKQNEKLEDKLTAIREQAIIDRQSARTANLTVWKLEKEIENLKLEKNSLGRRMELTEDKLNKFKNEKEDLEFKIKQHKETILNKEKQIDELKSDIQSIKDELKKERNLWNNSEKDRLQEKTELIECVSKIQNLEEKLTENREKVGSLNDKVKLMTIEQTKMTKLLRDTQDALTDKIDEYEKVKQERDTAKMNFDMLKEVCKITEVQLTEMEEMLDKEAKRNKENCEKIDGLWKKIKEKETEISKLKNELGSERSSKSLSDNKSAQMYSEYEELSRKFEELQKQMINQQKELIEKTSNLFEVQERIEILNLDTSNLQKLTSNYEQEHRILKEENTKILTDLYLAKEHITKQNNEIKDHKNQINELNNEVDHLKTVLLEQKQFYHVRNIKDEETVAQHKKLIEYLQMKIEEFSQKKKKTIGDILFGSQTPSAKKENVNPNAAETVIKNKKLEEMLVKERARVNQLTEQLMRTKTELIVQQSAKGKKLDLDNIDTPIKPSAPPLTPTEESKSLEEPKSVKKGNVTSSKSIKEQSMKEPIPNNSKSTKEPFSRNLSMREPISIIQTATKSTKRSLSNETANKTHTFEMTVETSSSTNPTRMCPVCDRLILAGHAYWKCTDCDYGVHRKCRGEAQKNCEPVTKASSKEVTKGNVDEKELNSEPINAADTVSNFTNESDEKYVGDFLFERGKPPGLHVNDIYDVNEKVVLLACDNGLYSYNNETYDFVHIKGIEGVQQFAISSHVPKAILIADNGKNLYQCDLRHLESRAQASACLAPKLEAIKLNLSFTNAKRQVQDLFPNEKWHLVRMADKNSDLADAFAVASSESKIIILKFDTDSGRFKALRGLDANKPVSSILFTKHTAIVSTDKFYEIDFQSFMTEEILETQETSACQSMACFRINSQEYLLCFKEYGIFIDEYGCRSRPEEVQWIREPLDFMYQDSFLFIAHADSLQVMYIHKSYTKEIQQNQFENRRALLTVNEPKLVSFVECSKSKVYVCSTFPNSEQEVFIIDGCESLKSVSNINQSSETLSSYATTMAQSIDSLSTLG